MNERSDDKSSEGPTPRTDAIISGGTVGQIAMRQHAEQLERELAEAKRMHAEAIEEWAKWEGEAKRLSAPSSTEAHGTFGPTTFHPPFRMMKEEGDHWIEDSNGLPVDRGEILNLLNTMPSAIAPSLQALADIKWDVHNCDWSCERCGDDPGMKETDIALTLKRFEEAHGALPEPYSAHRTERTPT